MWDFWLYQGDESERTHTPLGIVTEFVGEVKSCYPSRPFIFVADSYYGSLEACLMLNSKKFGCLFEVVKLTYHRDCFQKHLHQELKKREWQYTQNKNVVALSYFDKSKVNILPNFIQIENKVENKQRTSTLPLGIACYRLWCWGP